VNEIPFDPDPTHAVWFQVLNSTGSFINYGANGLQRLDYVISSAERHGIKLVLPFMNNWDDFGGINTYSTAFGSNATTFYTTASSQAAYKSYIKTLVTRYAKSPAIFAWELGNEPRCHGCDTSVITKWATEISAYIKSLDPNHLVTLGDEGWLTPADAIGDGSYAYSGIEGIDFVANLAIKTLDYGVFHLYPDSWGYNYTWGSTWIQEHDAVGKAARKPVILEEYGSPFPHNHTAVERPWQQTVRGSGVAADQIWQFAPEGTKIVINNLVDVNSIFFNDTEYVPLARQHAALMLAK
jgi:mannan endo-1,4-beta-mannosidase